MYKVETYFHWKLALFRPASYIARLGICAQAHLAWLGYFVRVKHLGNTKLSCYHMLSNVLYLKSKVKSNFNNNGIRFGGFNILNM